MVGKKSWGVAIAVAVGWGCGGSTATSARDHDGGAAAGVPGDDDGSAAADVRVSAADQGAGETGDIDATTPSSFDAASDVGPDGRADAWKSEADAPSLTCTIYDVGQTCERAGYCGLASDGLGNVLQCGPCPAPLSCTGWRCTWPADAGTCVPVTCADYGSDCEHVSDGCGGLLNCGTCTAPQYCGGGGLHRCGGRCTDVPVSQQADCGLMRVCVPDAVDAALGD